jgi:uncharacterized protein
VLFVVQFVDVYGDHPELLPQRDQLMVAHLAYLAEHDDKLIAAGALRPSPDSVPTGGLWIVNADSKSAAEFFLKNDPFWRAGLRKSAIISHWAKAYWSESFAHCVSASGADGNPKLSKI